MENRVKVLGNGQNVVGTVRVAAIYSVGLHHMARYVEQFQAAYPGADVRIEYLHPTQVLATIREGRCRAGPDLLPSEVVGPDSHPLA